MRRTMPFRAVAVLNTALLLVLLAFALGTTAHTDAPGVSSPDCPQILASSPQTRSTNVPPIPLNPCPGVVMGTYLGGKFLDWATDVAVDPSGDIYVTGYTNSSDFPTTDGAYDTTWNGGEDAGDVFVARIDSSGALLYSTFLGGSSGDQALSIAVDAAGNVYVAGGTGSCDFPTTPGAYDTTFDGCGIGYGTNAFVAKFGPSGTLVYSTLLGGPATATAVSADVSGNAYVAGWTDAPDFPTTPGAYASGGSRGDGLGDLFVAKFDPEGKTLIFSAIIGGEDFEELRGGAVDPSGSFYATGYTYSKGFPVTEGAPDQKFDGSGEAFVFKLNPAGTDLVFSTYLGGISLEVAEALAVDSQGVAYVVGTTSSPDFPRTPDAIDTSVGGRGTFVVGLDGSGVLLYSALVGHASGFGISVDDIGQIYLTGRTESDSFPATTGAYDATYNGGRDAFVAKLAPSGTALDYATYLGGGDEVLYTDIPDGYDKGTCLTFCGDIGYSVFFDRTGNATVVGTTSAFDFPTTSGGYDTTFNGLLDVFVIRMEPIPEPNRAPDAYFDVTVSPDDERRVYVNAANSADAEDADGLLEVRWDWEDDGVWDTDWFTAKTDSHEYTDPGTYTIRLEVRDTGGLTGDTTRPVSVSGSGPPGEIPSWVVYAVPVAAALAATGVFLLLRRRFRTGRPRA